MVKRAGQEALQSGEQQPQQQKHETEIPFLLSSHPPTFLGKISRLMSWWREIRLLSFSLLPFSRLTKRTQRSPQPTHVLLSARTAQDFLNDLFNSGHRETGSKERGRSPLTSRPWKPAFQWRQRMDLKVWVSLILLEANWRPHTGPDSHPPKELELSLSGSQKTFTAVCLNMWQCPILDKAQFLYQIQVGEVEIRDIFSPKLSSTQ